jgi:hypothetical protein
VSREFRFAEFLSVASGDPQPQPSRLFELQPYDDIGWSLATLVCLGRLMKFERSDFSLKASNCQSLMRQLRRIGRRVGPRLGWNKRSKDDTELFCLRRYIATLAARRRWDYPCSVSMGERPDFMISARGFDRGLEVTQATTEAFQQMLTESERSRLGARHRRPEHQSEPYELDDGWVGDKPEREWCEAVLAAITCKVGEIHRYRSARHHDILIYSHHKTDVVRGVGGKRPEYKRLQMLARQNAVTWKSETRLGVISVIDGPTLLYDLIGQCAQWKIIDMCHATWPDSSSIMDNRT